MRQLSSFTLYSIFFEQTKPYRTELLIILLLSNVFNRRYSITREESSPFVMHFYYFGLDYCFSTSDFLQEMLPLEMVGGSMEKSQDFASDSNTSRVVSRSIHTFSSIFMGIFMILVPFKLALAQSSLFFTLLFTQKRPKSLPLSSEATSYMFSPSYLNIFTCPSSRQQTPSTSSPLRQAKELKLSATTQHFQRKANFYMLFMPRIIGRSRKYNLYRINTVLRDMLQRVNSSRQENSHIPSGKTQPAFTRTFSLPASLSLIVMVTSSPGRETQSWNRQQGVFGSMGMVRRVFARQSLRRERSQSLSKCLKNGRSLILMKRKGSLIESVLPIFMRILQSWKDITAQEECSIVIWMDCRILMRQLWTFISSSFFHISTVLMTFLLRNKQLLLKRSIFNKKTFCILPLSNLIRPFLFLALPSYLTLFQSQRPLIITYTKNCISASRGHSPSPFLPPWPKPIVLGFLHKKTPILKRNVLSSSHFHPKDALSHRIAYLCGSFGMIGVAVMCGRRVVSVDGSIKLWWGQ